MLDTADFKKFIDLHGMKKELEQKLAGVKEQISNKEKYLIDNLQSNDMENVKIAGKNCYIRKIIVASISDRASAIAILKKLEYNDYVKEGINHQSVSRLVRDILEEKGKLPEGFGEVITSYEVENLRIRNN